MKGKLWAFGDSFTKGGGLAPYNQYYKETYTNQKLWPDIVGLELNLEVENHGYSWSNTELIIRNILHFLPQISKKDIVIISNTDPSSVFIPSKEHDSQLIRSARPFDNNYPFRDDKERKVCRDYAEYCINPYLAQFDKFWIKYLQSVQNMLTRLKIKNLLWTRELWYSFESIEQATNGRIQNFHWSWKGHEQMADYIIKQLNND